MYACVGDIYKGVLCVCNVAGGVGFVLMTGIRGSDGS